MSYPPQPPPAGQPGYQPFQAPNHPKSTTVLVLGILSLVVCSILGPFAWVMGNRTVREIDASGGQYGGRDQANIGRILGIISSVLLGLGLLAVIGVVILGIIGAATSSDSSSTTYLIHLF